MDLNFLDEQKQWGDFKNWLHIQSNVDKTPVSSFKMFDTYDSFHISIPVLLTLSTSVLKYSVEYI